MNEIVTPSSRLPRSASRVHEDVMALLWAEGTTIMPDWGIVDMPPGSSRTFFAGTDTTTHAMANAFYLMLAIPGFQESCAGRRRRTSATRRRSSACTGQSTPFPRLANVDSELGRRREHAEGDYCLCAGPGRTAIPATASPAREVEL